MRSVPFTVFPATLPSVGVSALILITLTIIFGGSWFIFWLLVVRSTAARFSVTLREWGRERGMRLRKCEGEDLPTALKALSGQRVVVRFCLIGKKGTLIRVKMFPAADPLNSETPPPRSGSWNLLIREISATWPATGLRPAQAPASVVDLYSLSAYPLLGNAERFVVYGSDPKSAAALSRSSARGLLPPDVGLLLLQRHLLLDFSSRPFDTIEFDRVIAIAEQIQAHLPVPDSAE